ncbi:MAG: aminotransferase class V-fold PLP-dependent enzyme [Phycisphaerales bacterium]|nr:aminotransferase class V-fold PLP-dependent enzyme [Phycisphaerales bacterium]
MDWIYLDNNATTQPAPEVVRAMRQILEQDWANPSSVHRFGQSVRHKIELARAAVAGLIAAKPRELIFTSGGTESNNLALRGVLGASAQPDRLLVTSRVEHSAILQPAEVMSKDGFDVAYVPIDDRGAVLPAALQSLLHDKLASRRYAVVLVSLQWANNEVGTIQPVSDLADAIRRAEEAAGMTRGVCRFHVDATQAVGKIPIDVTTCGADLLSFAAHKFHGPKGVGVLWVRSGLSLRPQLLGGPQERDRRGGTENTPGIVGLGVAADLAKDFLADAPRIAELAGLRDRFERSILDALPYAGVNAAPRPDQPAAAQRLWNTTNIGFKHLEAEAILLGLSERGVCASAGAACSSGSLEPSPVLLAMGIPEPVAHGSVRFSLSRLTTGQEMDQAAQVVVQVVSKLAKTLPLSPRH